jgi:peptidoglycan/LPS O-acetylase OafA/YrhL
MGSSLVLLGLFNAKGVVSQVFQQRQFVLLGEASYALYLIHGPVGSILEKVKIHPKEHFSHFILFTVVAIAVSIASFKLVEIPARNWITSRFKNPSSRIKGSASTS